MEKDPSPLDTLRQLKEWLDAGTITPAEFETLKRKLLFSESTPAAPSAPVAPVASVPPPAPVPPTPAVPPAEPAPFQANTIIEPVQEPVAPRITPAVEVVPPFTPPVVPVQPVEPVRPTPEFIRPPELTRPTPTPEVTDYDAEPTEPEQETLPTESARSPLSTILIVGGIVALLALVAYLMLGNRESEHLSSISQTEADSLRTAPETGPQADQIDLPAAAAPETVRVVPAVPPATASAPAADSARSTAPAETTPPAEAPAPADDSAVRGRVEGLLSSYYEDLKAPPFSAAQYFAPSVERFYTQQNTTPAAINEELARTHFPEFLEAETQIEPGSLKISEPVEDGSRVVTYTEKSSALRQSLQKHQQIRAQVRIRLDRNFKIKYLRQERLLENTFTD